MDPGIDAPGSYASMPGDIPTIPLAGPQVDRWFMFFVENITQWTFPFFLLLVELSICTFIVLPLPSLVRKSILRGLMKLWNTYPRFRLLYKTLMAVLVYLFADSLRRMYATSIRLESGHIKDYSTLYASERNAYLCGFTIFLFLLLLRFEAMLGDITNLELQVAHCHKEHVQTSPPPQIEPEREKKTMEDQLAEEKLQAQGWVKPSDADVTVIEQKGLIGDLGNPRLRVVSTQAK